MDDSFKLLPFMGRPFSYKSFIHCIIFCSLLDIPYHSSPLLNSHWNIWKVLNFKEHYRRQIIVKFKTVLQCMHLSQQRNFSLLKHYWVKTDYSYGLMNLKQSSMNHKRVLSRRFKGIYISSNPHAKHQTEADCLLILSVW